MEFADVTYRYYADGRPPVCTTGNGVAMSTSVSKKRYPTLSTLIHRQTLQAFMPNPAPDIYTQVDHINHDPKDFRLSNLRWVTTQMNQLNRKGCKGYTEVRYRGRTMCHARIKVGRLWALGHFDTEEKAHACYEVYRDLASSYIEKYWRHYIAARQPGETPDRTDLMIDPTKIDADTLTIVGRKFYKYMP